MNTQIKVKKALIGEKQDRIETLEREIQQRKQENTEVKAELKDKKEKLQNLAKLLKVKEDCTFRTEDNKIAFCTVIKAKSLLKEEKESVNEKISFTSGMDCSYVVIKKRRDGISHFILKICL